MRILKNIQMTVGESSPFLFPEGFDGKEYYGDKKFYEYMLNTNTDYSHIGTSVTPIQDGMVICDNDKLYRYSKGIYDVVCLENPVFKFDFSKIYGALFNADS